MTFSLTTLSMNDTHDNAIAAIISDVMLNVIMLSVIMLSVIMLNVIMLNVVAPIFLAMPTAPAYCLLPRQKSFIVETHE
jgi:hypothetical protein